ncbi:MAG TPA: RNA polymerase sigma factor [Promineifilum sp.]
MSIPAAANRSSQITRTNPDWIAALKAGNGRQAEAINDLRVLLLRAALYTLVTHIGDLRELDERERLALAEDCAQDALLLVLSKLDSFRGESKFTTWAYKFGINVALTRARQERWRRVSLDALAEDEYSLDWLQWQEGLHADDSEASTLKSEVGELIGNVLAHDLTNRQRQVLKWIAFDEVPMDVIVQRLNTNRNAVYKTLHDARWKVKRRLSEQGYDVDEVYELFRSPTR